MTREELNERFQRYVLYYVHSIEKNAKAVPDRRDYLLDTYDNMLADALILCRDNYHGHLITLMKQGTAKNLPMSYIYEEMERYRQELIKEIAANPSILQLMRIHKSIYREGYWPKYHTILKYYSFLAITRYLRQWINRDYPLELGDGIENEPPLIFDLPDEMALTQVQVVSTIVLPAAQTPPAKERRLDYPEEMNAQEAAEYLSTTIKNLYQLTSSRAVPHYKRGRKLMFRKSELENWRQQKVSSKEEIQGQVADWSLVRRKR